MSERSRIMKDYVHVLCLGVARVDMCGAFTSAVVRASCSLLSMTLSSATTYSWVAVLKIFTKRKSIL